LRRGKRRRREERGAEWSADQKPYHRVGRMKERGKDLRKP